VSGCGLGEAVRRVEDERLLTGRGRFVADLRVADQAHALVLRAPYAHAEIVAIDAREALRTPGVLAVYTAADLAAAGLDDIPCGVAVTDRTGQPLPRPGRRLLARDRVRFAGEPVAFVVAETLAAASDGLDRIAVDYRPLPALASLDAALDPAAVPIWAGAPGNIAFFWERGDEAAVARAIAAAEHRLALRLVNNRVVPCTLEPRACLGSFDAASGTYTLHTSSQGAHLIRDLLARATLKVPPERIRVVVEDVGGGFGTKAFHYPEEALVLFAAARIGRPVRWVGDRADAFLGDTHGRDQINAIEAGFDAEGRLLALSVHTHANMGAYLNGFAPAIPSFMTGCMLSGAYAIPLIYARCEGVYTNTVPVDAYRGAGRPEATYLIERLMDHAARVLGVAPDAIRRRNFIAADAMPYRTASGCTYDSGDFARRLDQALAAADWQGFAGRRAEAASRGRLRGIGLSSYVEICGYEAEEATIRLGGDDVCELLIGTQSTGQGHQTAYAQIVSERLGVPFAQIRVVQGDTARITFGKGTSGSRSLPVGGPAVAAACAHLIAAAEPLARRLLQAGDAPLAFAAGRFVVRDSDRSIGLVELARAARAEEGPAAGLAGVARYDSAASTFPNGCHVCEVEIDPETGAVDVVAYHVVDDFGTVVNPLLLAGQVQGGVAQGIGQALIERTVYDPAAARLLTASFFDYRIPAARDVPPIRPIFDGIACQTNPLGIKGAGEAGAIAACPAVINAVLDALAPLGVEAIDMPATPEAIWRAIESARRHGGQP
jgi:carbon-monoxide dehydrogenase large subunit